MTSIVQMMAMESDNGHIVYKHDGDSDSTLDEGTIKLFGKETLAGLSLKVCTDFDSVDDNDHRSTSIISMNDDKPNSPALPKINNQSTIIMRAATFPGNGQSADLMLMHNTRIFYFEPDPTYQSHSESKDNIISLDDAAEEITDNINDMLMTPKYRSLSVFYLSFYLLDHAILVSIILSLFTGENSYLSFVAVFLKHAELFGVIALEAIYHVLEYNVRVWILNRVSMYFVFVLYALYCAVITINTMWNLSVIVLLSIRFASYLCELWVDSFIDLELHHDLRMNKIHRMPSAFICKYCGNIGHELKDEHDLIDKLPLGWRYKGSIWSSTTLNAFEIETDDLRTKELSRLHRCLFEIMVMFTIIITSPVTIIVALIMCILSMIRSVSSCCDIKYNRTICAECTRNTSW